jgi:RimJ/RimL family protein N-acetyltransferase
MAAPDIHPAVIRTVGPADVEALRDLRLDALRLCPTAFTADLAENETRPIEWWRDVVKKSTGGGAQAIFVAETNQQLLGMAGIAGTAAAKQAHRADIWGVYVRPTARGQGLGARLVSAAVDWARDRRLVMVTLAAIVGNEGARRCYERAGFTVYGVQPMVVRVDGVYYDEWLMAKRLAATSATPSQP